MKSSLFGTLAIEELASKAVPTKGRYSKDDLDRFWRFICTKGPFLRFDINENRPSGKESRMLYFLELITTANQIPDLGFIYYHQDCLGRFGLKTWIQSLCKPSVPIFVSAKKTHQRHQILFCDWHYDPRSRNHADWNMIVESLGPDSESTNWESKVDRLIWRGGPNDGRYTPGRIGNYVRGSLVLLAQDYPELIDASFNNYPPNFDKYRKDFEDHFPDKFLNPFEMARFKYQIDIDGVTATFSGLAWKLLSGSLVFKQHSDNKTWFHDLLIPWVHYVPLNRDISDLLEKLSWARANDNTCRKIALAGRQLIKTHVLPSNLIEYCSSVLVRYSKLFI
jgi:hypothetical protein